jgi:hypothetical protein
MKQYTGSIYIEPWAKWRGGGTSAVTYELLAQPDTSAPKRLINGRVEVAVAKFVHALRERVNDLRRSGRLHPRVPPSPNLASSLTGPRPAAMGSDVAAAK